MIYWICTGDGLSMISIWSSVLKLLSGRCSRSTRRWMGRTLSRRREWTSIKVIMRRWFDTEWLRRTSIRRATSTDPMSLRPCSHRKWMLFRMDMTDDRVREGWRTRRDRVFARRTELKSPPQSPRDLERCPRSSHAAAWRDVDTSWQCSVHYFVSKFRCDLIYLKSALVTVVCPCTPWCRIHDIHIWWTSCAHSAVKGKVTKVHFIILSLTRHFILSQWPLSVILSFSARSYENSFIWSSSMHLSQSKWMGDFLVRVEISFVLSVLSRLENRRRVWEWKKSRFFTSESALSRFLDFPKNGQYFPSEPHRVISSISWVQHLYEPTNHRSSLLCLSHHVNNTYSSTDNSLSGSESWTFLWRSRQLQTRQTVSSETSFRVHPLPGPSAKVKVRPTKKLHRKILHRTYISPLRCSKLTCPFSQILRVIFLLLSTPSQYIFSSPTTVSFIFKTRPSCQQLRSPIPN